MSKFSTGTEIFQTLEGSPFLETPSDGKGHEAASKDAKYEPEHIKWRTSMKFPLAVSVAIGATLAQAAAVPTGLLGERCTPGTYYCNQSPVFECGTYYGAIHAATKKGGAGLSMASRTACKVRIPTFAQKD
ncbi:hypothetical protein V501_10184 [Pseudogymnoascus sp. VKM F-4519 (FW-2642)]|nr:hypothetical protein V501_10184 [Pseudogymnoascus sp. VKM F-4519 (FW-2642)]